MSRAIRDGDCYQTFFEEIIGKLDDETRSKFNIIRWKDIQCDRYSAMLEEIKCEFECNEDFRNEVLFIQDAYINRRTERIIPYEKKLLLCNYLLEELPTIIDGIYYDGKRHSMLFYPTYLNSSVFEFVCRIQKGQKYSELTERLDIKKTIIAESLIDESFASIMITSAPQ